MIRIVPALLLAAAASACMPSRQVVVVQEPVMAGPVVSSQKRITRVGAELALPDGTRVVPDQTGGFILPNGDYVTRDARGALVLPTGSRCLPDAGGYACP